MLMKLSSVINPQNDPIFEANYKFLFRLFRPIVKNDDKLTYEFYMENSVSDIIKEMNRLFLQNGQARCNCKKCGARIRYLK